MRYRECLVMGVLACSLLIGCGQSNQAIMPVGELTEEQKAAVKAEDASVEEEESQGKIKGGKAVKK